MKFSSNDPISNLKMSTRLYNALRRNGIHTIGSFIDLSEEQLNEKRNIGKKSIDEHSCIKLQLKLLDNQSSPALENYDRGESTNSEKPIEKADDSTFVTEKENSFSSIHITVTHDGKTHYFHGDLSLENLAEITGMTIRTYNCLKRANINQTSEVVKLSNDDLIELRNMGNKSRNETLEIIAGIQINITSEEFVDVSMDPKSISKEPIVQEILIKLYENIKDKIDVSYQSMTFFLFIPIKAYIEKNICSSVDDYLSDISLLEMIFSQDYLTQSIKKQIILILSQHTYGMELSELLAKLPDRFRELGLFEEYIFEMESAGEITISGNHLEINYLSVLNFIKGLADERKRAIVSDRMEGKTLDEIAIIHSVSRERIRQIIKKTFKTHHRLREDKYITIFEKYAWTPQLFTVAFEEPEQTYQYLSMVTKCGQTDLSFLIDDIAFPEEFKKLIVQRLLQVDYKALISTESKLSKSNEKSAKELAESDIQAEYGAVSSLSNKKVSSPFDRLKKKIMRGFKQKRFIGDIEVSDDEFDLLIKYTKYVYGYLKKATSKIIDDPLLCVSLVQIGIRYYDSSYWEHVKSVLEDEHFNQIKSAWLSESCIYTLQQQSKLILSSKDRVSTILMHGFVSDNYSENLFNFLFAYYKLDLERDLTRNDRITMQGLMDCMIRKDNTGRTHWIVQQTADALRNHPQGYNTRIRRLLRLIDGAFWGEEIHRTSNNRLTRLFYQWRDSSPEFNKDVVKFRSGAGTIGKKAFTSPYIKCNVIDFTFGLVLPTQLIRFADTEDIRWEIRFEGRCEVIPCLLYEAVSGYKSEEVSIQISDSELFESINIILVQGSEKIRTFRINTEQIRFFEKSGDHVYSQYVGVGEAFAFSDKSFIPISDALIENQFIRDLVFTYFDFQAGDIVQLPDGKPISIGNKIEEGLMKRGCVIYAHCFDEGTKIPIYSTAPTALVKFLPQRLNGAAITINGTIHKLNSGEDVLEIELGERNGEKGYLIHLQDYGCIDNRIYEVKVDIPNDQTNRTWRFAIINHYSSTFEDGPYIFAPKGTVRFNSSLLVKHLSKGIERDQEINTFNFEITPEREELSFLVEGIQVDLKVPMFSYSFDLSVWSTHKPPEMWYSAFPRLLYFKYPAEKITLSLDVQDIDEEEDQEETFEKIKSTGIFECDVTRFRSWFNRDQAKNCLNIQLPERDFCFLEIVTKSTIQSSNIIGDFESGNLIGDFDIIGKSNYYADIHFGGNLQADKVLIENGRFVIQSALQSGTYMVSIYEDEEDDSGFGETSFYLLKELRCDLVNPTDLRGKSIKINCLKKNEQGVFSMYLSRTYIIKNLHLVNEEDRHTYTGILIDATKAREFYKVNILIKDLNKLKYAIITFYDDYDDLAMLLYDYKMSVIVREEEHGLRPSEKYRRYICLFDDEYVFGFEFLSNLEMRKAGVN